MPHRLVLIQNMIEIALLNLVNILIYITWRDIFACLPIIFSLIYSVGKIKRDIDKYYDDKTKDYLLFLIGKKPKTKHP